MLEGLAGVGAGAHAGVAGAGAHACATVGGLVSLCACGRGNQESVK